MTGISKTDHAKGELRSLALAHRRDLETKDGSQAAAGVCREVLSFVPSKRGLVVAGYWPLDGELDPRPAMTKLAARGCRLALPEVVGQGRPLRFRLWRPGVALEEGAHGTWHPLSAAPLVMPEVVLVPMLAFDRFGYRLGFGGGYYDRTLAALRRRGRVIALGVAFAGQEVMTLPRGRYDEKLDVIITEEGALMPKRTGR